MRGIAESLNAIKDISIDEPGINKNVNEIFAYVEKLGALVEKNATSIELFKDKIVYDTVTESKYWGLSKKTTTTARTVKNETPAALKNVRLLVDSLYAIRDGLMAFTTFTLDTNAKTTIDNNIDDVFDQVQKIADHTEKSLNAMRHLDLEDLKEQTGYISEMFSAIQNISDITKKLSQNLIGKKDGERVTASVGFVFETVDEIIVAIYDTLTVNNNGTSFMSATYNTSDYDNIDRDSNNFKKKKYVLNNIEAYKKYFESIKIIFESLEKVVDLVMRLKNEIKFSEADKELIKKNLTTLFTSISDIILMINDLMKNPLKRTTSYSWITLSAAEFTTTTSIEQIMSTTGENYKTYMESIGQMMDSLNSIVDAVLKIKDIRFKKSDATIIAKNVNYVFEAVSWLISTIYGTGDNKGKMGELEAAMGNFDSTAFDSVMSVMRKLSDEFEKLGKASSEDFVKNGKTYIRFLTEISAVKLTEEKVKSIQNLIETLSTTSISTKSEKALTHLNKMILTITFLSNTKKEGLDNTKKITDAYSNFLNKVNSIDIDKLKTTASMFNSMAELSKSIKGNFEGLAESINEDLMPVLEELKAIMEKIPEKLDTGFQNTNKSFNVAMTGITPTREELTEQIKQQEPTLTAEQVDEMTNAKLNAYAKEQVNSVSAKLDKLMSLLKGSNGTYITVNTI